jgi:hypothetical protein
MRDQLRDALKRVEPPQGFAERVLEQVRLKADLVRLKADTTERARTSRQASPFTRWAVAATLIIAVSGGAWYGLEMRRREGEEARRQVLMSLNIAGSKLRTVQMQINHEQER